MPGKKRRLNKQPDTPASVLTSRPKTSLLAKPSRILENILFSQQVESLCSSLPLRPENDPYWAEFAMEQLCRVMKSSDRYNVKEVLDLRYRFSRYWPVDETIMYFIAREMCKVYGRENLNSNVILAMIHEVLEHFVAFVIDLMDDFVVGLQIASNSGIVGRTSCHSVTRF